MATAKQLPSGSWRVRVYSHTDDNGKKIYQSFTAPTKVEAELQAAQFSANPDKTRSQDITVKQAVETYIEDNEGNLSPSTLKGYRYDLKRMEPIWNYKIRKLTSSDIQKFIKKMIQDELSPKSIRNTYTCLTRSLRAADLEVKFKVNLPEIPEKDDYALEDEQVMALFHAANPVMKKVIIMACHSMRLSEICGVQYGDFEGNTLRIKRVKVDKYGGGYEIKEKTKTKLSKRRIYFTDAEMAVIGRGFPNEPVIPIVPRTVDGNFAALRERLGLPDHIIIHGLRSYYASISVALNIPEKYIEKGGGWKPNSAVLKKHYEKPIESKEVEYRNIFNNHMDNIIQYKAQ